MTLKIRTYTPPKKGRDFDWTLEPWKPGQKLMVSPWREGQKPYRKGQRVRLPFSNHWSFGMGSVYNWVNNGVYGTAVPDTRKPEVYFLRGGAKHCAGVVTPERDIFVDGDWFYYIKSLVIGERKGRDDGKTLRHIQHSWTFTIDSQPHDVPVVVKRLNEIGNKQYMDAWVIGDLEITISHASATKRRWLSKAVRADIKTALERLFARSTKECSWE